MKQKPTVLQPQKMLARAEQNAAANAHLLLNQSNKMQTQTLISMDQARNYLDALDLSYIVDAMCAESYPLPRWTKEDAEKCCQQYKNFLLLQKQHAPMPLVPTCLIDEFWHNHILYTKNYTHDCLQIFGYYLHHQPASPTENTEQLITDFSKTKTLYLEMFNESL